MLLIRSFYKQSLLTMFMLCAVGLVLTKKTLLISAYLPQLREAMSPGSLWLGVISNQPRMCYDTLYVHMIYIQHFLLFNPTHCLTACLAWCPQFCCCSLMISHRASKRVKHCLLGKWEHTFLQPYAKSVVSYCLFIMKLKHALHLRVTKL